MKSRFCLRALSAFVLAAPVLLGESKKDRGHVFFQEKGCAYCHRMGGVGGVKGPALDGIGKHRSKEEIENQIRNGSLIMPAFGDALTPAEIDAIAEFLHRSITVPAAVRVP